MPEVSRQTDLHPYERAQRQRTLLLKIVRAGFLIVFVTVAALALLSTQAGEPGAVDVFGVALRSTWQVTLVFAIAFGGLALAVDLLTPQKKISTLAGILVGLLTAMLLAAAAGFVIDLLVTLYEIQGPGGRVPDFILTAKLLIGIGLGYVCISTVLQTQDDFRLVIPYVEFAKQLRGPRALLLDSSTLIDARIVDIAATGLIQSPLIVPRFVIDELQTLADRGDDTKRARGRRGLDTIAALQHNPQLDITVDESVQSRKAVDQMLVELAQRTGGIIASTDTGLRSVAEIHGIGVVSVHELARACRPISLPGAEFTLRLVREGEQPGQAVGYLDDGTMVVVNDASHALGRTVRVLAESTIPTAAGRIIFASMESAPAEEPSVKPAADAAPDPEPSEPASSPAGGGERLPDEPASVAGDPPVPSSSVRPPIGPRTGSRGPARRNPRRS